ncbi:hypothetical protein ACTMTF_31820 [Nonomuraea sp. ZG12]|uniref:hypothetical protein n=1 Tax=Nonomuraea sp. ZG12 TaxID=3452207 RepID=UPI003F8B2D88
MPENATLQPPLPALTRILIGPPGKVLLPLTVLVALIILNGTSMPGGGPLELMLLGLGLTYGMVIVWVARFVVALFRSDGRPMLRRHWVRWAAAPVLAGAVIGSVYADLPFKARFALSESSLESFARTVASSPESTDHADQWVGLYPLTSISRTADGAHFLVSGTGFLSQYGFGWSPKAPPAQESHTDYTHIQGPWYIWEMQW